MSPPTNGIQASAAAILEGNPVDCVVLSTRRRFGRRIRVWRNRLGRWRRRCRLERISHGIC